MTARLACNVFGRSDSDDLAAAIAAFGADIDDPVGGFDHIKVVLDHDHSVAALDQLLQHLKQLAHIFKMQACCRLIQDIERAARGALGELLGELDALRLAA